MLSRFQRLLCQNSQHWWSTWSDEWLQHTAIGQWSVCSSSSFPMEFSLTQDRLSLLVTTWCDHMMSCDAVGVDAEKWDDTQPSSVWHDKQSWSTESNTTTLLYRNKQVTCDVKWAASPFSMVCSAYDKGWKLFGHLLSYCKFIDFPIDNV